MTENRLQIKDSKASKKGRLQTRPLTLTKEAAALGLYQLRLAEKRDALLYVPKKYKAENPAAFALMLHGAGGNAEHGIGLLRQFADDANIILLAPASQAATWDVIADTYGVDVEFIDLALEYAFERFAVDKSRLAVGGFSDGASYALSLGLINGDLFSHVIAFSPGFMAPTEQTGVPRIYISHGTGDRVLPIERCSRRIAPQLKRGGYEVLYREFDGAHTIPHEIALESVRWFEAK